MKYDLENMDLKELKSLQKDVAKAINDYEERKRHEALSAAQKKVAEFGFKLEDLMGGKGKKPKANGVARYAHPENPTKTWTGKGRKPAWVNEHLDAGKPLEDLAI